MLGGDEKSVNLADHLAQVGAGVVAEGGGGLQHVVEDVAVEHQALLGLQPVGPGEAEGDGSSGDEDAVEDRQHCQDLSKCQLRNKDMILLIVMLLLMRMIMTFKMLKFSRLLHSSAVGEEGE